MKLQAKKWEMCCESVPTVDPETGRCQNGCGPKTKPAHTPTLGESLDHYGEEYCTRAVNVHQEILDHLKWAIGLMEKTKIGHPTDIHVVKDSIAKAEGRE